MEMEREDVNDHLKYSDLKKFFINRLCVLSSDLLLNPAGLSGEAVENVPEAQLNSAALISALSFAPWLRLS